MPVTHTPSRPRQRHPVFAAAEAVDWFAPVSFQRVTVIIDLTAFYDDYQPTRTGNGTVVSSNSAQALLAAYRIVDPTNGEEVTEETLAAAIHPHFDDYARVTDAGGDVIGSRPARFVWDTYVLTPRLPDKYTPGTPEHDRLVLAAMIPEPAVSQRVYEWPEDEAEMHRASSEDFMVRAAKMSLYRRLKTADRMIAAGIGMWTER